MAMFDKQSFTKNMCFGTTHLHAHVHYIFIVCAKYQKASVKVLVQVDFLMYALYNPYLIGNRKKWLSLQSYHFVKKKKKKKIYFGIKLLHTNVHCVYIV